MNITLVILADEYYSSHDFKHLRDETKRHYQYLIDVVQKTQWMMLCLVRLSLLI